MEKLFSTACLLLGVQRGKESLRLARTHRRTDTTIPVFDIRTQLSRHNRNVFLPKLPFQLEIIRTMQHNDAQNRIHLRRCKLRIFDPIRPHIADASIHRGPPLEQEN